MRRAGDIIGLSGTVLPVAAIVSILVARPEILTAFVFAPYLGVVLAACVLSLPVVALAGLAYGRTRPTVSATLYFIASAMGVPVLLVWGLLVAQSGWSLLFAVPVLLWLVAGILVTQHLAE